MRKFLMSLMLVFAVATPVQAQTQDTGVVVIPRSALTAAQLKQIETDAQIHTAGKWVGLGKEAGEAVNSSLAAVTEHTAKFANTPVGKLTMGLVVWKVVGKEILGTVLGILYAVGVVVVGVPLLIWSYRRRCPNKILVREEMNEKGKVVTRVYRDPTYEERSDIELYALVHGIGFIIVLAAASIVIF